MTSLEVFPEPMEPSPGKLLAARRAELGLSIDQVAKQLYMTVSKVKALENDDYGYLNSDTFIRGYMRAYANMLQLDVVQLLNEYDALIEARTPKVVQEEVVVPEESSVKVTGFFVAIIAVFFVFVWLIDKWFFDTRSDQNLNDARVSSVVSDASQASLAPVETQLAVNSLAQHSVEKVEQANATNGGTAAEKSAVAESAQNPVEAVVNTPAVAAGQNPVQGQEATSTSSTAKNKALDEISFHFAAECWLEVSDSRGDVLATELQPAGSNLKLVGRAPFDVKVGNAPSVGIELNGKKVEVIPLLGTNVLTLKVGQ